jgi:hypothetical protein
MEWNTKGKAEKTNSLFDDNQLSKGKNNNQNIVINKINQRMKDYQQKVNELRAELIFSIISLLKEHGLKELEFSDDLEDLCYVVWFDNKGNAYDSPVRKVSFDTNGICLNVQDEDSGFSASLSNFDIACQNLDWLCDIYYNISDTLSNRIIMES